MEEQQSSERSGAVKQYVVYIGAGGWPKARPYVGDGENGMVKIRRRGGYVVEVAPIMSIEESALEAFQKDVSAAMQSKYEKVQGIERQVHLEVLEQAFGPQFAQAFVAKYEAKNQEPGEDQPGEGGGEDKTE